MKKKKLSYSARNLQLYPLYVQSLLLKARAHKTLQVNSRGNFELFKLVFLDVKGFVRIYSWFTDVVFTYLKFDHYRRRTLSILSFEIYFDYLERQFG